MTTAAEIIAKLGMQRHPEGGWYVESYRHAGEGGGRGACTAIYFLLPAGERSHWHKVDAVEIWHWYAGAPLELGLSLDGKTQSTLTLGPNLESGQRPQAVVPTDAWQAAASLGDWTLVGCTVSPAFDFAGFELAPPGWEPGA